MYRYKTYHDMVILTPGVRSTSRLSPTERHSTMHLIDARSLAQR
mgnify:CR=1 FL=1